MHSLGTALIFAGIAYFILALVLGAWAIRYCLFRRVR